MDQNDPNFHTKFLGFSLSTNRYLSIMPGYDWNLIAQIPLIQLASKIVEKHKTIS